MSRKKPAPDIYLLALSNLGLAPDDVCVVEDSGVGCRAAIAAGCPTVVTVSDFTAGEDFSGARLVVNSLGDDGIPVTVMYSELPEPLPDLVVLDTLFLAGLYTLRVIAGAAAISVVPSFWLMAFSRKSVIST